MSHSGFTLSQASAIATYLATNSPLYPIDLQERAFVHSRLFFYACRLEALAQQILDTMLFEGSCNHYSAVMERLRTSFATLDKYLRRSRWVCGANETIVDYLIATLVTTLLVRGNCFSVLVRDRNAKRFSVLFFLFDRVYSRNVA